MVIDAVDNVRDRALGRRGQKNLFHTGGGQMLTQPGFVFPDPGIVNQDGVFDPERTVVDFSGVWGIDELDAVAIGDQAQLVFIHLDRGVESPVNAVCPQQ